MTKPKLIVDTSSVLSQFMHLRDEEYGEDIVFNGEKFHIPSLQVSMEKAEANFQYVLDKLGVDPTDVIMVKDPEAPAAARKRKFPDYKGKRTKRPPLYYQIFNQLVENFCEMVMRSGGVSATPRIVPTVEADDLVNELAMRLPNTIIFSTDKDLLACPATHHYIGNELDPMKFPVPREFIHLYRSIMGDTSDNLPGCKGFGEKTWEKMVDLIGSEGVAKLEDMVKEGCLRELEEDVKDFKPFKLLIEKADDIYLSYDLMSFYPIPAHKIKWEARVQDTISKLVTATNYKQVIAEVDAALVYAEHSVIDFETDVPPEAEAWLAQTKDDDGKGGVVVDVIGSEIVGMGLKLGDQAWYFSVGHADTDNVTLKDLEKVVRKIQHMRCFAHNSTGFENVVLYNHFGFMLEGMVDTHTLGSYVNENDYLNLKHLSKRDLGYEQTTYQQVLNGRRGMRDISGEEVVGYGIDDCITCDSLQNLYHTIMMVEGSHDVFYEVEQKSALVTSRAFVEGVGFDRAKFDALKAANDQLTLDTHSALKALLLFSGYTNEPYKPLPVRLTKGVVTSLYLTVTGKHLATTATTAKGALADVDDDRVREALVAGPEAWNKLYKETWVPSVDINVRSPKQVQELLYVHLKAITRIRNPATDNMRAKGIHEGNPSTDDEAIASAIAYKDVDEDGVRILQTLLEYKGCLTKESLFYSKYPKLVHWKTGKLHCSMKQCGASTRRFTHSAPNLAQLPKKKGREVRDMIVAPDGFSLVAFDFGSQELRLQAEDCGCSEFQACYLGDKVKDVHSSTGFQVAIMQGAPVGTYDEFEELVEAGDKAAKQFRSDGKQTNFASAYGCRAKRLANMLAVPEATAQLFLDAKAKAFPGLLPHVASYNRSCRQRGYSETFMGVRRHLAKSYAMAKGDGAASAVDRLAWSFRIQGSGAEQVKLAMSRIYRDGIISADCYVAMQIHDELVFCIRDELLASMIPKAHKQITANYAGMKIPMVSSPETGKSFGSLSKFKMG